MTSPMSIRQSKRKILDDSPPFTMRKKSIQDPLKSSKFRKRSSSIIHSQSNPTSQGLTNRCSPGLTSRTYSMSHQSSSFHNHINSAGHEHMTRLPLSPDSDISELPTSPLSSCIDDHPTEGQMSMILFNQKIVSNSISPDIRNNSPSSSIFQSRLGQRRNELNDNDKDGIQSAIEEEVDVSTCDDSPSMSCIRILVVDDVPMNRRMLCHLVQRKYLHIDEANDGLHAVQKYKESVEDGDPYGVILMDFQMPNMDGPTASNVLREMRFMGPIIGVTGNALPTDIATFLSKGASRVLVKPVQFDLLETAIREELKCSWHVTDAPLQASNMTMQPPLKRLSSMSASFSRVLSQMSISSPVPSPSIGSTRMPRVPIDLPSTPTLTSRSMMRRSLLSATSTNDHSPTPLPVPTFSPENGPKIVTRQSSVASNDGMSSYRSTQQYIDKNDTEKELKSVSKQLLPSPESSPRLSTIHSEKCSESPYASYSQASYRGQGSLVEEKVMKATHFEKIEEGRINIQRNEKYCMNDHLSHMDEKTHEINEIPSKSDIGIAAGW
eukprot:CAMPEP_0182438754 /NCGR_PEP_ID=MMETSP1167-20130531/85999_1 /TAXON_ID=2988 /ORGANISM="Mallomonas Sp, Strain CCMP3275" /LENGTH=550 /DNA_ID=CAMNT_0024632261 /DNA_START=133 /DNA_END=1782 /DNA_ORIENTATION=+